MTVETPAHELTRNPVDGTWGFICREHGIYRGGLAEAHALNVERKHLREDHADPFALVPELNLTAMAQVIAEVNDPAAWRAFNALTGLDGFESVSMALFLRGASAPIRAAVVPL